MLMCSRLFIMRVPLCIAVNQKSGWLDYGFQMCGAPDGLIDQINGLATHPRWGPTDEQPRSSTFASLAGEGRLGIRQRSYHIFLSHINAPHLVEVIISTSAKSIDFLQHSRSSKTGDTRCNRHDPANHVADKESAAFRHSDEVRIGKEVPPWSPKVASSHPCSISSKIERLGPCSLEHSTDHNNEKWLDKYPVVQHQEASMLEEGQLPSEEPENKEVRAGARKRAFEKTASTSAVEVRRSDNVEEKKPRKETVGEDNKAVGGYDNHRILETLAKMEKRRERFKEPIAPKKEPDKSTKPQPEPVVETAEAQPQRPARKRRWGGC